MQFRKQKEDGSIETWWNVESTGHYGDDCAIGQLYAVQFISAVRNGQAQTALSHIVSSMPKEFTGIEIGFLHGISEALKSDLRSNPESASLAAA